MSQFISYEDASRRGMGPANPGAINRDDLVCGALLRIAASLERLVDLQDPDCIQARETRRVYDVWCELQSLERSVLYRRLCAGGKPPGRLRTKIRNAAYSVVADRVKSIDGHFRVLPPVDQNGRLEELSRWVDGVDLQSIDWANYASKKTLEWILDAVKPEATA